MRRHRFHSICPYFAMFPEAFAEIWIERLTKPGDIILDPFCGRGTALFQALLMQRNAAGCDTNPVAYCVTKAKTNAPPVSSIRRRLTILEKGYIAADWESTRRRLPRFFRFAYNSYTLREILYLRAKLQWQKSDTDCMIAAIVLGILHGESEKSQSYLSNQMPRTISTKPRYSMDYWSKHGYKAPKRDVFELLRNRLSFRYESPLPEGRAFVARMDMRNLPSIAKRLPSPIRCVITSPPYLDVTNYEEDQWLRLWFLGGEPNAKYGKFSKDDRHESAERYWNMISDMWGVLGKILHENADVVIRLGGKNLVPSEIAENLLAESESSNRKVNMVGDYEVSAIRRRQTDSFRPGARGCSMEVDCHFRMK